MILRLNLQKRRAVRAWQLLDEKVGQGHLKTKGGLKRSSAFGLVDPGIQASDGMPQTSQFGGVEGYSSYPMYQQAVNQLESERPGQARQYNNLFVDPMSAFNYQPGNTGDNTGDNTGGNTGGSSGGSGNNGGDYDDNYKKR